MTRISNAANVPLPPEATGSPSTESAATASPLKPASAHEVFRIIEVSIAPGAGRSFDLETVSKTVIDWWMRQSFPAKQWQEREREQLREHLVEGLRDDPAFQALVQKIAQERDK